MQQKLFSGSGFYIGQMFHEAAARHGCHRSMFHVKTARSPKRAGAKKAIAATARRRIARMSSRLIGMMVARSHASVPVLLPRVDAPEST